MAEETPPGQGKPRRDSPEISPTQARQSEKGRGVIYVLVIGLVLASAVWAIIELTATGGASPDVETVNEDVEQVAPAAQ